MIRLNSLSVRKKSCFNLQLNNIALHTDICIFAYLDMSIPIPLLLYQL